MVKESVKNFLDERYKRVKTIKVTEDKEIYILKNRKTGNYVVEKIIKRYCEVYKRLKEYQKLKDIVDTRHITKIYFLSYDGDETLIIEEYVRGITLRELLNKDKFIEEKNIAAIMINLCDMLFEFQMDRIVCRDLKPENIMIDRNGNIKVIDFDTLRFYDRGNYKDTILLGTEGYAAPEQYGYCETDIRTDIYALGVMMQEMLGGKKCSRELKKVIRKCCAFDPEERYGNIIHLRVALEAVALNKNVKLYMMSFFVKNLGPAYIIKDKIITFLEWSLEKLKDE